MTQAELADAVNEYVRVRTGRAGGLRGSEVGRYERGEVWWPSRLYREAFRNVLNAGSDRELGFFPTPRGVPLREAQGHRAGAQGSAATASMYGKGLGNQLLGSRIIARALIRRGDQILVVRADGTGGSYLPGGHVGPGPVQATLLDHVAEQTGRAVKIIRFVGGVEDGYNETVHHAITLVFEAEIVPSDDGGREPHLEAHWLAVAELADHDVRPVVLKEALIDGVDGAFWRAWTY
jgi:ADP-ribose pyrophosphatase YjhB (NUDIX family)